MADVVSPAVRSRMMAGIRGKNTRPELLIRRALHAMGYRYRLHGKLPGKPDLVFASRKAVIFIHGCFWHGHDCSLFRLPGSRTEFWKAKIEGNRVRDAAAVESLTGAGWRCLTVWECSMRGRCGQQVETVALQAARWLDGRKGNLELRGAGNGSR